MNRACAIACWWGCQAAGRRVQSSRHVHRTVKEIQANLGGGVRSGLGIEGGCREREVADGVDGALQINYVHNNMELGRVSRGCHCVSVLGEGRFFARKGFLLCNLLVDCLRY